jgi:N-acetylneuraminic acid mutarotase
VYDPASNTWSRVADVPERISHAGVATDGVRIIFAGGFVGDWKGENTPITSTVRVYNTSANSWSTIAPLPAPRAAGALVRVGRKLHFFGGLDSAINDSGSHWVLDLRRPTAGWKTSAPLPNPRNHLGYTEYLGKIFAIGGQHRLDEHTGNDTAVHAYDPVANKWNPVASLRMPRSHTHNSTFVWNGRITMIGGSTQEHTSLADLTQYDPKRNRWVTIGYLPSPRSATSSQLVGTQIITVGGTPTTIDPRAETFSLE